MKGQSAPVHGCTVPNIDWLQMTHYGIVGMQHVPKASDCAPCCVYNIFVLQLIQIATGHTHSNNLLYSMYDQALLFVIGWSNLVWQMVPTTLSLQGGSSRPVPNQRGRSGDISGHHNSRRYLDR